ncbi:conserved hypothetical protein [Leishmania major strain Friedlin]|uniref:Uncharacterized protein n=1 Tax=Leishmania major TaxID=5664 RepID=Q4Q3E9_LEIMA|nr:conserved hypothetical protein [Leishmania major strain Friedlin]CAG9581822.1 hypothetical_protein_-_conserved [Leishmania major strain Friedlin]CAJ07763.1 conserved hypothetical protein [Leishmania major strain Friedlin]|eukprot:XP_001686149.1 conserved hypothetical protein [Leishmania major strain Friedlin]
MQRLACVRFVRRMATASLVSAAACEAPVRFSSDYVNKAAKKKLEEGDDERWLEAEMDKNISTPEERYAHAREIEALKRMVSQLKEEHKDNLEEVKRDRSNELDSLKKEMSALQQKISKLTEK